jgi:hypothetical protein
MIKPSPAIEDQIDLKEIFRFFRHHVRFLFICIVSFGLVAFLIGQFSRHFYQSTSKFITKTSKAQPNLPLGGLASLAGLDMQNQSNYDPSLYFADILQDDEFLKKILGQKWRYHADSMTLESIWKAAPDTTLANWQYVHSKKLVGNLKTGKYLTLEKSKANGVISLTTLFEDADLAYQVNSRVIELLGSYLYNSLKSQAKQKRLFVESRIIEVEKILRDSENDLVRFQQQNADVSRPHLLMEQMRMTRNVKINEEMLFQLRKEFELAKLEELKDQPLIEVISKPTVPIFREKPKKKVLIAIGLIAGMMFGIFAVCGRYWYSKL